MSDIIFEWLKDCFEIIDEELAKEPQEEPNTPLECVDGSCPIALSEEYEEWGMDVVHSYAECPYQPQELVQDSQKLVKELAQDRFRRYSIPHKIRSRAGTRKAGIIDESAV